MGGSPELAYLTSLRDPSPSSTFQRSSLMGQDPSGCAECSWGRWVCRHLVLGACHSAWRLQEWGQGVVPQVAQAGRGQLWPSEPSCPICHLTGVCTGKGRASMLPPACPTCAMDPSAGKSSPCSAVGLTVYDWRNPTAFSLSAHPLLIHVAPVCGPVPHTAKPLGLGGCPSLAAPWKGVWRAKVT